MICIIKYLVYIFNFGLLILIILSIANDIIANDGAGGQPGAFMRIPVNARANGMGSAFTAVVQDPSAGWWNPAGLTEVSQIQLIGMYSMMSMDRSHNFIGLGVPLPWENFGSIGLSWLQFGVSDIDGRDFRGQPTSKFNDNEMAFSLSYAYQIRPFVSVGLTGKYLHHSLADYSANGFGLDVGVIGNIKQQYFLGFNIQNILGSLKWNTVSDRKESLPIVLRAGLGFKPGTIPLTAAFDLVKIENGDKLQFYIGTEYWLFRNIFALRAGYAFDHFNAGASFGWQTSKVDFQLDYAFIGDALEEGATNQFSFLVKIK